jgi:uncharacterized protein YlxP (DUF503 family)
LKIDSFRYTIGPSSNRRTKIPKTNFTWSLIWGQIDHVVAIISLTLELHIEQAQSLKDRRQVVRSLKEKLRRGFNISIAEMDEAVTWQSATIGVTAISRSRDYLSGLMRQVEDAAVRIANDLGAQVADSWCSFLEEETEE